MLALSPAVTEAAFWQPAECRPMAENDWQLAGF
jgi:hypothetical protein